MVDDNSEYESSIVGPDEDVEEENDDLVGDFYSPKSEFPKPKLVAEQIQAISKARSVEMRPGYTNISYNKEGEEVRADIPDTRKMYVSSVIFLRSLLRPEINKDKISAKFCQDFDAKLKKLVEKWHYVEYKIGVSKPTPQYPQGYPTPIATGRAWMPNKDERLLNLASGHYEVGLWNSNVNSYWDELVILYDDLFGELNCLIERLGYYKPSRRF